MPALPLDQIRKTASDAGFTEVAVAFHDYETTLDFAFNGDRMFHAASTFKVAVLVALYRAVQEEQARLEDYLHVRNRFLSVADGSVYKMDAARDGDSNVYKRLGSCMRVQQLAKAMIVRSSNLATNLLIDYLGLETIQNKLAEARLDQAIRVLRGVEDDPAFERGINNETTANGLVRLYRQLIDEDSFFNENSRREMLDILLAQEFKSMIPAELPSEVDVAHKTGEISIVCHDAGVVFTPDRKPYIVAILTEAPVTVKGRKKAVAEISRIVFQYLRGPESKGSAKPTGS